MVSHEDIVRTWQAATCYDDVLKALPQMKSDAIRARVNSLRKKGVPLKKFNAGSNNGDIDYKALASLARELLNKH